MMAFDEAKFRSAAKAAGYSDEEIDAELGTPAGSVAPQAIASGPETAAKFDAEGEANRAAIVQGFEESSQRDASQSPMTVPGVLTSPTAWVSGGAALGALAAIAAPKVFKSVKERYMTKAPELDRTIDIPTGGFFDVAPDATLNPLGQPTPETIDKVQRAAQLAEANRQLGLGNQPVAPGPIARNALPMGAVNPAMFSSSPKAPRPDFEQPVSTPISAAPIDAPAATPSAKPNSFATETIVNEVKDMIQKTPDPQELRTGTGKPAFAGQGPEVTFTKKGNPRFKPEYGSLAEVPTGYAFVPEGQNMDTLRQILGQGPYTEEYKKRNFPQTNELAIQEATAINRTMNRPTRAEMIASGMTPAPNTPGITQYTSKGTKPTTIRGLGVGALVAIPDLVKAQTAGERAMAGANLLEAVMPPGFMMSGAGEGSGAVPSFDQAMLLGSPYAQSDIAKKRRQQEEYTRKVGGGRGLTPASAYPR
jgi:hypothetical protein